MSRQSWRQWLWRTKQTILGLEMPRAVRQKDRRVRPQVESLEERAVPTSYSRPQSSWLVPPQVRQAYGFNNVPAFSVNGQSVAADGSGQTIAIVTVYDDPNIFGDLAVFDQTTGLGDPPSFQVIGENGLNGSLPPSVPQGTTYAQETSLDVEWAHAMAPGANILLVEVGGTDTNGKPVWSPADFDQGLVTAASFPGVSVVSSSYGRYSIDSTGPLPVSAAGVTFVSTAGDQGQFEYPYGGPTSLIVGGTQLSVNSNNSYGGETTWFNNYGSTGGGEYPAAPAGVPAAPISSWQAGRWPGYPNRISPDVAYAATNPLVNNPPYDGFAIYDTYDFQPGWTSNIGTSAGAPQWAALIAIANQGRALELPDRGPLNGLDPTLPMLYSLPSTDFHQIPASKYNPNDPNNPNTHGYFDKYGTGQYVVKSLGSPRADRLIPDLVTPFQRYSSRVVDNIQPVNGNPSVVNGQLVVYGNAGPAANDQIGLSYSTNLSGNQLLTVTDNGQSDSFDLTTFNSVVIYTRAAADTVTVQMTPAGYPPISVTVEGGQGSDDLVVADTANTDATNYTVTDSTVRRTNAGDITFSSIGDVRINGGSGDNNYHVQNTDPDASTEIYTGDGLDHVYVEGTQGPLTVNLGANANDTVELSSVAQSLDNLTGDVSVNGTLANGSGQGTLILDDQNTQVLSTTDADKTVAFTVDSTGTVGGGSVTRTEGELLPRAGWVSSMLNVGFTNLANLVVNGGNVPLVGNTFNVQSTPAGTAVTIQAGNAGDQFVLGDAGNNLDNFAGALTLLGGAGKDKVTVNDQADVDAGFAPQLVYDLRNSLVQAPSGQTFAGQTLSRTGTFPDGSMVAATINYANVASATLNASPYGNEIDIESTRASTPVTINAGAGNDTINAGGGADRIGAIQGDLTVNGQGGNTTLNVNDSGTLTAENYTVYADHMQRSVIVGGVYQYNTAVIGYHQVGHVIVEVGQDKMGQNQGGLYNTLDVMGTAPGADTSLYGNSSGQTQFAVYPWDGPPSNQILGAVHFFGGANRLDTMSYYDYIDPSPETFTLSAGQIQASRSAAVTYQGPFYSVDVTTSAYGQGGSHVNVLSTSPAWTVVQANAGDTVTIGSQAPAVGAGTLAGLNGLLTITTVAPTQSAKVILDDQGNTTAGKTVTFNNDGYAWGISNLAPHRIYFNLGTGSSIQVLGGSGGNGYDIQSTPAGTALTVQAGSGTDTINVGGANTQTLDPILGSVTVNGQGANTTLNYNDRNSTATNYYWYNVSPTTISRMQVTYTSTGSTNGPLQNSVTYSGIGTLNVDAHNVSASAGSSYYAITGTARGTKTNVNAGTGYNEFIVEGNDYTLNAVQGQLFLHGSGAGYPNNNTVFIDDLFDPNPQRFLLTAGATAESGMVQRFAPGSSQPNMAAINYDGINSYAVLETANSYRADPSHNATVDIQGNAPDLWTIVAAGTGDTVNVGTPAHTMNGISGDLRIQAYAGQTPTVNLDDSGDTANKTIDLADEAPYGYRVTGLLSPGAPSRGRIWLLDPAMNVTLKTGSGNDAFRVHDSTEAPVLTLDGGGGTNWLDYSAYGSGVAVNLAAGTATGFAGISGIENVVGSLFNDTLTGDANNNVLIGLSGNDVLQAGSGRDILIGGDGNSTLQGGSGEDILIGGWTTYDRQVDGSGAVHHAINYDALDASMAEWASGDSFVVRQQVIASGVGSGSWALNATTVFDASVADTLVRNGGTDWVFAGRGDSVI
jgi:hypothetical protein